MSFRVRTVWITDQILHDLDPELQDDLAATGRNLIGVQVGSLRSLVGAELHDRVLEQVSELDYVKLSSVRGADRYAAYLDDDPEEEHYSWKENDEENV